MKRISLLSAALILHTSILVASTHTESKNVMVGGKAMLPTRDIVANAMNSGDHTTLVAAVKGAGLVSTLQGKGPFTVFAPTNAAFNALPKGTVDGLMKPESKTMLSGILTYHVVAGRIDAKELMKRIKAGGGKTSMKTVNGATLSAMMNGPMNVILQDEKGNVANISTYDVFQSNGVIHVVDRVLMPK